MGRKFPVFAFDLGGVVFNYDMKAPFRNSFQKYPEFEKNFDDIFSSEWNRQQELSQELWSGVNSLRRQYPQFEKVIPKFYTQWEQMITSYNQGVMEIIKTLRYKDYEVYALSNLPGDRLQKLSSYSVMTYFSDILISGEISIRKPDKLFFQYFLRKYQIHPENIIFIDDNIDNVSAAQEIGIKSVLYTSNEHLLNMINQTVDFSRSRIR